MKTSPLFFAAIGIAGAMAATPVSAADTEGNFALRGFGAQTCVSANAQIREDPAAATNALAWLLGYMTAINRAQSDTFDVSPITDGQSKLQLVAGLCAENPDTLVETVVFDLLRTVAVARVRESSEIVETSANGAEAHLRRETLQAVQAELIELGHLEGTADGAYGPQTRGALRAFQEDQGLDVTGVPDAVTVLRLLVDLAAEP